MSYICRDCAYKLERLSLDSPRCPNCGSMYLLQDKHELAKKKREFMRIRSRFRRRKKEEPLTLNDRLINSIFTVFVVALTLIIGPMLSVQGGVSGDYLAQIYGFIFEWWWAMLFGGAVIGFVFDIDMVVDFFGVIWGTTRHDEKVAVVLFVFALSVLVYAFVFR